MYSELMLHSNAGLKTRLMVSNIVYARRFADFFTPYHSQTQRPGTGQTNDNRGSSSKETRQSQPNHSSAYDILGVNANATMEEITSAYIHLAQMYHPDKVAGLGLELRELAEKKMKEINVAYDTLKKTS
jgi:DnaJ like chaperone protein